MSFVLYNPNEKPKEADVTFNKNGAYILISALAQYKLQDAKSLLVFYDADTQTIGLAADPTGQGILLKQPRTQKATRKLLTLIKFYDKFGIDAAALNGEDDFIEFVGGGGGEIPTPFIIFRLSEVAAEQPKKRGRKSKAELAAAGGGDGAGIK